MKDQGNDPWFLIVNGLADHSSATFQTSLTAPVGPDLTPTQPYWLALPGVSVSPWYLYLNDSGVIQLSTTPPAVGTGLTRVKGLSLSDQYQELWHATISETLTGGGGAYAVGLYTDGLYETGSG